MRLLKETHITTATDPPETIVHVLNEHDAHWNVDDTNLKTYAVTAVHYKPPEDRKTQRARHGTVQTEDQERQTQDWKETVDIESS